jgi:hypothetical protein
MVPIAAKFFLPLRHKNTKYHKKRAVHSVVASLALALWRAGKLKNLVFNSLIIQSFIYSILQFFNPSILSTLARVPEIFQAIDRPGLFSCGIRDPASPFSDPHYPAVGRAQDLTFFYSATAGAQPPPYPDH